MLFGAMNFPVTPVLDEIETFARLGFDYLELAMDPPMAHHSILSAARAAITQALKDNGMGLVCHLPTFLTTADLTESLRRASVMEMRQSLDVAADLGAKKVVLHPSMAGGMGAFVLDTVKGYAFDFLSEMVEAAQHLDTTICLENMFPRYQLGVEPDDFEEIFKAFPSLKLTLDTGHANIDDRRGRRLKELVGRFGNRIGHIHISDNQGKRDDHLAVGRGTVKFANLVRHLKATGYDDTITLEIFEPNRKMLVESRERIKAMFAGG
ncbi:MAG: sugar phosphate isomerase/epimerase [Desulfosarcina sp.]|nr:sugar phosphate isomerase/epimerase [Desulfosarcina sp.]MBC2743798.1 sugar phosphate isomerase/epimerase [Desulfosarcina sp.]MBC2766707.1 sugar phosphate isomerase/epimerase [Desulfosarcina sp.]